MKKFDVSMLTVAALLLGLAVLGVSQAKEKTGDTAVGKVGNVTITQSQLYDAMKLKVGKSVMNTLISDELIRQEAAAKGVTVTDEELDKMLKPLTDKFKTPEKLDAYLQMRDMDEKTLREKTKILILRDKLLEQAYPVTDEDIKAYYDKNKDKLGTPAPTLEQARTEIIGKINDRNRRKYLTEWLDELKQKYSAELIDKSLEKKEVTSEEPQTDQNKTDDKK